MSLCSHQNHRFYYYLQASDQFYRNPGLATEVSHQCFYCYLRVFECPKCSRGAIRINDSVAIHWHLSNSIAMYKHLIKVIVTKALLRSIEINDYIPIHKHLSNFLVTQASPWRTQAQRFHCNLQASEWCGGAPNVTVEPPKSMSLSLFTSIWVIWLDPRTGDRVIKINVSIAICNVFRNICVAKVIGKCCPMHERLWKCCVLECFWSFQWHLHCKLQ